MTQPIPFDSSSSIIFTVGGKTYSVLTDEVRNLIPSFSSMDDVDRLLAALAYTQTLKNGKNILNILFGSNALTREERFEREGKVAYLVGSRVFSLATAVHRYLKTWHIPSVRTVTRSNIDYLQSQIPNLYYLSAHLCADTGFSKDKMLSKAVYFLISIEKAVMAIIQDQYGYTNSENRGDWQQQMIIEVRRARKMCQLIRDCDFTK